MIAETTEKLKTFTISDEVHRMLALSWKCEAETKLEGLQENDSGPF